MSIKNKIHHTVYFLLFGIIIGILRWTICIVDTNGGMNFTPFLQAFLLIIALLLFVIWDIVLHKITLRVISTIILLCFNIWSYTYYFKIEELKEYWDGVRYSPNDAYLPPNIDNFRYSMVGEPSSCFVFTFSNRHFTSITEKKDISKA